MGLTFVYALSGLAVNHIADWDPNFVNSTSTAELGAPLPDDDDAAKAQGPREARDHRRAARGVPRGRRAGDPLRAPHAPRDASRTGHIVDEGQKPRFFIRAANWLHLNRGKKAWTYFADSYAVGLLFLACSGLFMLAGKKGLFGRGIFFVAAGVAIPIVYLALVKG